MFGISTTLRAGRSGDLVSLRETLSFLLPKIVTSSGAQTASSTMGTLSHLEVRRSGLSLTYRIHLDAR